MTDDTLPMTDERAAFEAWHRQPENNAWREQSAWAAWQARASLASPAAPHPAQQAQPMTDEWAEAQRIRDLPAVDDAIRNMLEDQTGDNATCMVREVLRAGSLPAQQAGQPEDALLMRAREALESATTWLATNYVGSAEARDEAFAVIVAIDAAMPSPTAKKGADQ